MARVRETSLAAMHMACAMCEHCDDPRLDWEETVRIEADEEPWNCDIALDEDVEPATEEGVEPEVTMCPNPAVWETIWTSPLDHLCEEHKKEHRARILKEHGEIPPPLGLPQAQRFYEITPDRETCEEIVAGGAFCGRPARWVELESVSSMTCDEHIRESDDAEDVIVDEPVALPE